MTDLVVKRENQDLFAQNPAGMMQQATEIATILRDVIRSQKLSVKIGPSEHVKVEGWATLGCILGILPREKEVVEQADGSYMAVVELYSLKTGGIVGQGSAICGSDEKRWADSDRYARRSMAITRATGKAYRLGFAWIMALAGYNPTPAEEMPEEPRRASPALTGNPLTAKWLNAVKAMEPYKITPSEMLKKVGKKAPKDIVAEDIEKLFIWYEELQKDEIPPPEVL